MMEGSGTMFMVRAWLNFSEKRVSELITTGVEGGCGDWLRSFRLKSTSAEITERPWYSDPAVWRNPTTVVTANYDDGESGKSVTSDFDMISLVAGLQLFAEKEPEDFMDFIEENEDAYTADLFFQYWLLGEKIFA
jgi:hypothetical protein